MLVNADGSSEFMFVCSTNSGLLESTRIILAFGAYSAINCRQAPQGVAPPFDAIAIALKSARPSVRALKMAIRSAQQLRP